MYKSLQSCRAYASLMVMFFHVGVVLSLDKYFDYDLLSVPFRFGSAGVEFFFVLSGFIIFYAHKTDIGRPSQAWNFVRKRFVRVYPIYWFVFLGVFVIALCTPSLRGAVPNDLWLVLKSLSLFPQDKYTVGGTGAPVLIVAWTLQFEVMFYSFFLLSILNKNFGVFLLIAVVSFSASQLIYGGYSFPFGFVLNHHVWCFLFGIFAVYVLDKFRVELFYAKSLILFGSVVFVFLAVLDVFEVALLSSPSRTVLYGFACAVLILGLVVLEDKGVGKFFWGGDFVQLLGAASYSLYLVHFPLISVMAKVLTLLGLRNYGVWGGFIAFVITSLSCIVASIFVHIYIERKLILYFNRAFVRKHLSRV